MVLPACMRFSRNHRLRNRSDFEAVRSAGTRIHCGAFIFQARPRERGELSRVGIITSRKVGNAVVRNRARRLFRELFREHQAEFCRPVDLVIVVRSTYLRETFQQLEQRFCRAVHNFNRTQREAATPADS